MASNALSYYFYEGVNTSIRGEGGPECLNYLDNRRRFIETIIFSGLAILIGYLTFPSLKLPFNARYPPSLSSRQRALLTFHGICFGAELGFKLATRTLIFVFNPCHLLTIIQCILLSVPPSPLATALYRIHLHWINGPIIALLFPITESRLLPFESTTYYIQHLLIVLIPAMLMKPNSPYSVEAITDFSWPLFALSMQILYHFCFLQPIGLMTTINMNTMVCPGSSDPFEGQNYRIFAMLHQPLCIMVFGKLYAFLVLKFKLNRFLRAQFNPTNVTDSIVVPVHANAVDLLNSKYHLPCALITELTASPFKSTRFSRFYYSAIPVSITKVEEKRIVEHFNYDDMLCNQSILFIPVSAKTCTDGNQTKSPSLETAKYNGSSSKEVSKED